MSGKRLRGLRGLGATTLAGFALAHAAHAQVSSTPGAQPAGAPKVYAPGFVPGNFTPGGPVPAGPNPYYRAPRSVMSRNELAIDWQHLLGLRKAAHDAGRPTTGTARGQSAPERVFDAGEAMPEEAMYAMLADGDPRPLLVLRECKSCEGLEDPLLVRDGNNERVMLMSRWFRCVRVGYEVVDEKHVLRGLFPGKEPGYVFVSHADGSARIDLPRDASTSKITGAMKKTLASRYRGRPDRALKALFRILDEYDDLDVRLRELNKRMDLAVEEGETAKHRELGKEHEELLDRYAELQALSTQVSTLELQPPRKP